jgi:hypothetical protein
MQQVVQALRAIIACPRSLYTFLGIIRESYRFVKDVPAHPRDAAGHALGWPDEPTLRFIRNYGPGEMLAHSIGQQAKALDHEGPT